VGFIGVPCALSTVFIALLPQLVGPGMLTPVYRLGLLMAVIGLAFLTVSTIRYPNPMKSPWILALLGVTVGCVFYGAPVKQPAIYALLITGALYILLAPLSAREKRLERHVIPD
jgi:phosphatidylserine synthase